MCVDSIDSTVREYSTVIIFLRLELAMPLSVTC